MKILYRKIFDDGRKICVYDEGGNNVTILIRKNNPPNVISVSLWNWEEKLISETGLTKEELGL